jgi:hypothetical protein
MSLYDAHEVGCPHCGADTLLFVDPTEGDVHELIEDCQVCCRAILFRVETSDGRVRVHAQPTE